MMFTLRSGGRHLLQQPEEGHLKYGHPCIYMFMRNNNVNVVYSGVRLEELVEEEVEQEPAAAH